MTLRHTLSRPAAIRRGQLHAIAALGAAAGVLAVLYRFPPERFSLYPACPFHQVTGLLCPGCGGTRALSALLHGRVGESLALNPLVAAGILCLAAYLVCAAFRGRWPRLPAPAVFAFSAVCICFAVVRNLA